MFAKIHITSLKIMLRRPQYRLGRVHRPCDRRRVVRRPHGCGGAIAATPSTRESRVPRRNGNFLTHAGSAILVMELQGALFFGTGETMVKGIDAALRQRTSCVVLDLRRLTEIDSTGTNILLELKSDLGRRKIDLLLAVGDRSVAKERLEEFDAVAAFGLANIFPDVDRAIERAEDDLLRTQAQASSAEIPLANVALFAGCEPSAIAAITASMTRKVYDTGAVIFREGDPGDEVLIVIKGAASAYLQLRRSLQD